MNDLQGGELALEVVGAIRDDGGTADVVDRPPAGRSAYAAAKSAQIGLTRSWARELAPFGITVNRRAWLRPCRAPR